MGYVLKTLCAATVLAVAGIALLIPGASAARYVYVTDLQNNRILQYQAASGTGALTPLSPSSVPTGNYPGSLAFTPSGQTLYNTNAGLTGGSPSIGQFSALLDDGQLNPLSPPTLAVPGRPVNVTVHPNGQTVYVSDLEGGGIYIFKPLPNGELGPSSVHVLAGVNVTDMAISPDTTNAYAVADNSRLYRFLIDWNGALILQGTAPVDANPWGVAVNPASGFQTIVANQGSNTLSYYATAGGSFAYLGLLRASGNPMAPVFTPDGNNLYVLGAAGVINQYRLTDRGLEPNTPATVPAGTSPRGIAVSPDGRTVYVADAGNGSQGSILRYSINADGTLQPQEPTPVAGAPGAVAVSPTQSPVPSFTATAAEADSAATFDASGTKAPGGEVVSYRWDFGDGKTQTTSAPTARHVYARPGTYTVTLTARNDCAPGAAFTNDLAFTGKTAACSGPPTASVTRRVTVPAGPRVVTAGSVARVSADGRALVRVRCDSRAGRACRGTVSLRLRRGGVAVGRFAIPRGATRTVTVRLGPRARQTVRRARRTPATAVVRTRSLAGRLVVTSTRRIVLINRGARPRPPFTG